MHNACNINNIIVIIFINFHQISSLFCWNIVSLKFAPLEYSIKLWLTVTPAGHSIVYSNTIFFFSVDFIFISHSILFLLFNLIGSSFSCSPFFIWVLIRGVMSVTLILSSVLKGSWSETEIEIASLCVLCISMI